ncbi:partial Tol-Pal system protein TolA, partial [Patescibacteria group bacterium]
EAKKAKEEAAAKAKAELQAEMEAEAEAEAKEAEQQAEFDAAKRAIMRKVENAWLRPADVAGKLECTIEVKLTSDGTVMSVRITRPSGNEIFDRSAESAVRKASPLPVPKDKDLFNEKFRTFSFRFKPE